jgi:hypothetical protein
MRKSRKNKDVFYTIFRCWYLTNTSVSRYIFNTANIKVLQRFISTNQRNETFPQNLSLSSCNFRRFTSAHIYFHSKDWYLFLIFPILEGRRLYTKGMLCLCERKVVRWYEFCYCFQTFQQIYTK